MTAICVVFVRILPLPLVADFREEKRGIRQRRKANRAKLLWPFREVQLYRTRPAFERAPGLTWKSAVNLLEVQRREAFRDSTYCDPKCSL
ncbi:hypothetical protein QVD17_06759 [Tagetes erecta]|uniref:Secreted protein n=1 Tax=Tagetes erecta TaxID=13708 RepID=A0AAD8P6T1_TARER|nr:hypothetical protein QVD17_06759 [Tagetes erecta]